MGGPESLLRAANRARHLAEEGLVLVEGEAEPLKELSHAPSDNALLNRDGGPPFVGPLCRNAHDLARRHIGVGCPNQRDQVVFYVVQDGRRVHPVKQPFTKSHLSVLDPPPCRRHHACRPSALHRLLEHSDPVLCVENRSVPDMQAVPYQVGVGDLCQIGVVVQGRVGDQLLAQIFPVVGGQISSRHIPPGFGHIDQVRVGLRKMPEPLMEGVRVRCERPLPH